VAWSYIEYRGAASPIAAAVNKAFLMAQWHKKGRVSTLAVKRFMQRPRDDFSRFLRLTERALELRKGDLPAKPPIWAQLKKHQKVMFLLGAVHKRFAFFADTGTGKTYTSIALMKYFMKTDDARSFLVLVPNIGNKWEWADEGFNKHAPGMKYCVLDGSSKDKWQQVSESGADIFIETYMGFLRMVCKLAKDSRKGKGKKSRLIPDLKMIARAQRSFEGVFADESTFLKNRDKLPYRLAWQLSKVARVFFILTGTPFGRDPLDLWSQMNLVDHGETLGETMGLFRQSFFTSKDSYWGGTEWKFNKAMAGTLNQFLNHRSITIEADAADLPHLTPLKRYATLGEDAESYYERAKETILASRGDYQEMKNAFLRARQISSGFLGFKNDETGERASFVFEKQPKLEALEDYILDHIKPRDKFIIFHEFKFSGKQICDMLTRNGIQWRLLNGDTKDPDEAKKSFRDNPKVTAFVLNNNAGGFGLNIQVAKYGLYYEAPTSPIIRKQTQRRFERQYSPHKRVFLVDFIVRGTADETILGYHAEGRALWRSILNVGRGDSYRPRKQERERVRLIA
jgi:SNF2 family DNA or RNA helicase